MPATAGRPTPGGGPTGAPSHLPSGQCGLPAPMPAGPAECADAPGGSYCRGHLGGSAALAAGASGTITLTPVNATEFVARSLHMTATSGAGVSPVTFTQAFVVTAIRILGDNQLADAGPIIGSTWSAQMTYLEVFWARVITATNPLFIDVTNLDPALAIVVYASVAGDFVKS
jgi:hypothetical protein